VSIGERPSLVEPGMVPLWAAVRERLERRGRDNRGRLRLPELGPDARRTLRGLLGRPPGKTVDLAALEAVLQTLEVGDDLPSALAALGHPLSPEPERRRAAAAATRAAHEAARSAARAWPEPWSPVWSDEVVRAGILRHKTAAEAVFLVADVRKVLDHVDRFLGGTGPGELGRTELAARLFPSSHALDVGTRLEAASTRALRHRLGDLDTRELWARAGARLDRTSGPALTWRLPLDPATTLGALVAASTTAGLPYYVTQLALHGHPVVLGPATSTDVLVTENPRVAEAAAERRHPGAVVATNGNPSGAVLLLVQRLAEAGARLRYHGDFDTAGLAICGRLQQVGLAPWRMTAADYLAAVEGAMQDGVSLAEDPRAVPATPWDPALQAAFTQHRLVIHEERLLDTLLAPTDARSTG
jgi:uncharacterized protein (TIGR02679 family)